MNVFSSQPGLGVLIMFILLSADCTTANIKVQDIRLVDGDSPNEGRIEYTRDNDTWETTCGMNLDIPDVIVICRHLGFPGGNRAIKKSMFGNGVPATTLLTCHGSENNITGCMLQTVANCPAVGAAVCYVPVTTVEPTGEQEVERDATSATDTMTTPSTTTSTPQSQNTIGIYAGVGGTIAGVIVIIIIIIIVIVITKQRDHVNIVKAGTPSTEMPVIDLVTRPTGPAVSNVYDGMHGGVSNEPASEDVDVYAMPETDPDISQNVAVDFAGMYAKPAKTGAADANRSLGFDAGELYAMPDKSRTEPDGSEMVDSGGLYAMPDKTRERDANKISTKPNDTSAGVMYAMPDKSRQGSNREEKDSTLMVENEIYRS